LNDVYQYCKCVEFIIPINLYEKIMAQINIRLFWFLKGRVVFHLFFHLFFVQFFESNDFFKSEFIFITFYNLFGHLESEVRKILFNKTH
jgi:hypothetical protein